MSKSVGLRIADDLALPVEAITETIAILGIRGSGKTNTGTVLAEELLKRNQQVVVIDPTDVWWGLKSMGDGTRAGFGVVVLGGKRADLPLTATDGATIADFVVDHEASVILSLRHFESKASVKRFVTDFARRLYFRKGQQEDPRPMMVMIDEASMVVPQRVMGDDAAMVGAIQALVRQGRSSGLGVTLIDQRPATVNKDVLAMLELLICHRVTSPQDRKALMAWVEQHDTQGQGKTFLAALASLPRGRAWMWSPGWLDLFRSVDIRQRTTFDSSRTPKAGERVKGPKVVATVDLDALKTKLAATLEKAKADDPNLLRKRIAEMQKEIVALTKNAPLVTLPKTAEIEKAVARAVKPVREAHRATVAEVRAKLRTAESRLMTAQAAVEGTLDAVKALLAIEATAEQEIGKEIFVERIKSVTVVKRFEEPMRISTAAIKDDQVREGLSKPEQRILDGIVWMESIGVATPKQAVVAFLAGYNGIRNGAYLNPRAKLSRKEFVSYHGERIGLTVAGRQAANLPEQAATPGELRSIVLSKLNGPAQKILMALIEAYPKGVENDALAKAAGYNGARNGAYLNPRSRLRTFDLVTYETGDMVRASDLLFPEWHK